MRASSFLLAAVAATAVSAKDIWVQVTNNKSADATTVFNPRLITAKLGDTVFFNFTEGNHTATQSTFASPCIPAHESNITINGFNSDWRNGSTPTILSVPILDANVNTTMWFFDRASCGGGGVGVINANQSSYENLDGFTRNAKRLNGSSPTSSSSSARTSSTGTAAASATASDTASNAAEATLVRAGMVVVPLVLAALAL